MEGDEGDVVVDVDRDVEETEQEESGRTLERQQE